MRYAPSYLFALGLILSVSLSAAADNWPAAPSILQQNQLHPSAQLVTRRLPPVADVQPVNFAPEALSVAHTNNAYLAEKLQELEAEINALKAARLAAGSGGGGSSSSGSGGGVMPGHSGATMKVVGRVHADAWSIFEDSPGVNEIETGNPLISPQDRLGFRRMRFGVRGTLTGNMEYRIEMEFAGGNNSEFRDAWLGWNDLPILHKLLIGNQKRPYGLDHLNSSRYNVFLERPFIIESMNQDARRLGIQSWGVSEDQAWNWRYGVFNQRLIQDEGNFISDHWQFELAGRLANTIWYDECSDGRGYAHWAIAGTAAHPDGSVDGDPATLGDNRSANEARFRHRPEARTASRWLDTGRIPGADWYQLLAGEAVVNVGPLQIVGEAQSVWMQRDAGFEDLHFHGAYLYASYFLTGEHMPWSRRSGTLGRIEPFEDFFLVNRRSGGAGGGWGAWQVAVRYSYADFNDEDIFGGVGDAVTFGLNWYWTKYARVQFNYLIGEIDDRDINNDPTNRNIVSGNYGIAGMRAMVDF